MKTRNIIFSEKGVVMVEAAIYFPVVICVVVGMLYYGLFFLQEAAMNYEVQRMISYASKDAGNPGYHVFPVATSNSIEFEYAGNQPSKTEVEEYYNEYHRNIGSLYRGIAGIFGGGQYEYDDLFERMTRNGLLFRFTLDPKMEVKKSLFGTSITASVDYSMPMPGVLRYLGLSDRLTIRSASYCNAVNPADFIRNTDLAVDLVEFAAKKLGISENLSSAIEKAKNIINTIF